MRVFLFLCSVVHIMAAIASRFDFALLMRFKPFFGGESLAWEGLVFFPISKNAHLLNFCLFYLKKQD